MKPTLKRYLEALDVLRTQRGVVGWKPEMDRGILAELEDWYGELTESDRAKVEAEGWRAWPEPEALVDRSLDAAEDGAVQEPPRTQAAA